MIKPDEKMRLCIFQIGAQKDWNLLLHFQNEAIHQSSDLIYSNYVPLTGTAILNSIQGLLRLRCLSVPTKGIFWFYL